MQDYDTTKYVICANIVAEGIVERPDVVGAIFGQTEGLLGDDLDLRDLQKTGRIGRIEVNIESSAGKSRGTVQIPSSLDKTETAILAAALETIDRVGPCVANIKVASVEDVRASKRRHIIDRAKNIVQDMFDEAIPETQEIMGEVKQAIRVEEITYFGSEKLPAGPNVISSDAILIVEGRADVLKLLRCGIKNAVAVEGTNVPHSVVELSKRKTVTAFTDGDRGGELILKELIQIADVDYVARAPDGKGVEELTQKEIIKSLRNKIPIEQARDMYALKNGGRRPYQQQRRDTSSPRDSRRQPPTRHQDSRQALGRDETRKQDSKQYGSQSKRILSIRRKGRVERVEPVAGTQSPDRPRPKVLRDNAVPRGHVNAEHTQSMMIKPVGADSKLRIHAEELNSTLNARLLDSDKKTVKEVAVRDLVETLKESNNDTKGVVFDGVITQRIIDIAAEKRLDYLIGIKIGNVAKMPVSLKIIASKELLAN